MRRADSHLHCWPWHCYLRRRAPRSSLTRRLLYTQMKTAYDKAGAGNWDFHDQEVYLSTIFNAGRAYSLQRPNDAAYGEIATLTVQIGSAPAFQSAYQPRRHRVVRPRSRGMGDKELHRPATPGRCAGSVAARQLRRRPRGACAISRSGRESQRRRVSATTWTASLQQVEANWRSWLLTHDASWRSLALERAAQPDFPLAHVPTILGPGVSPGGK